MPRQVALMYFDYSLHVTLAVTTRRDFKMSCMKTKIKRFAILSITLMGACKVSQNTQSPDMQLPASYSATPSTDTVGIAALPWQTFFPDPALQDLIETALARNNDMQIAIKNIEAAKLTLSQAKLGNLPALNLGLNVSSSRPSDNSLNGISLSQFLGATHIEDYTIAAQFSWEADIWGKIRNRKAAALAGYLQTEEAHKLIQTELIAGISAGYYNLLVLDAQLEIARRNFELNDSTLQIIQLQYNAGQVTSLAVQQADAQRLTAMRLIPQFERDIALQENALSILGGKLPANIARSERLDKVRIPSTLSAGVPSLLLRMRPDVRSAELALDRSNAEVGIAKAQMYPSLSITAQGGVNAFKASNWFELPASLFGVFAGGLTQPLFMRKELKTSYKLAVVEREKAVIQFRQQVLVAVGEVSDALVRITKLDVEHQIAIQRAETLHMAGRNASMLFQNGLANYLEVIAAQGSVLQSELELASIKKAQLDAVIDLYRSVGGGWR
jgi:NodT family efflux transporter outer membrane factor (OMF) lipoprotein